MNGGRKKKAWSLGMCIAIGAGVGAAMSVSFDNWLYLAIGIGAGVAIGAALGGKPKHDTGDDGSARSPQ